MSQLKLSNYRVNRFTRKENFDVDVEQVSVSIKPPTNLSDVINAATQQEGAGADASEGIICGSSSVMSKCASLFGNKKTAIITAALFTGGIFGASFGSGRAVEHKQPTATALALNTTLNTIPLLTKSSKSKSSKSKSASAKSSAKPSAKPSAKSCFSGREPDVPQSFCEPKPVVKCGQTVTNQIIVLSDDIFCTDDIDSPDVTNVTKQTLNAAIKLAGPNATIDCKGHTIRQRLGNSYEPKFAAACKGFGANWVSDPLVERQTMKETCELYYQVGIMLENGATAINCKVEQFYDGFFVLNGGFVLKSEAALNRNGVYIFSQQTNGVVPATKISDVHTHRNQDGVVLYHKLPADAASAPVVTIEDVTSKHNIESGINLIGRNITVKDSTTSYNGFSGISVFGFGNRIATMVQFNGTVSSHHNRDGISVNGNVRKVTVNGVLNTYLNDDLGLIVGKAGFEDQNVLFNVAGSGRFISCENRIFDIDSSNSRVHLEAGSPFGYTCKTKNGGQELPTCSACPACVQVATPPTPKPTVSSVATPPEPEPIVSPGPTTPEPTVSPGPTTPEPNVSPVDQDFW